MNEETQDFFEGVWHSLCAVVEALEARDPGARDAVIQALNAKIAWLATNKVDLQKAAPVLELRDWIIEPPRNPAAPYGDPYPPEPDPDPKGPYPRSARILQFRARQRP